MRGGPDGMNLAVVMRTTWAVAQVLNDRGLGGSRVVVGGDARHGSEEFALAAAEVFAAQGFMVTLLFAAVPTPVVAFGARHLGASAGIQITASHNPPSDNGYKVYFDGGLQIVPPTDREIEAMIAQGAPCRRDSEGGGRDVRGGPDPALRRSRCRMSGTPTGRRGWPSPPCTASAASTRSMRSSAPGCPTCTWSRVSSRPTRTSPPFRSPTRRSRAPPTNC